MNETLKRYLVSSITTFCAMFFSTLALQLTAGAITPETLTLNALISVGAVAVRAGIKAVVEAVPTLGSADKKV